jgi:hypothetical protein
MAEDCRACIEPDGGYVHTCPGSGTFLAAEAHVAGEVDEIAATWPTFRATLHLELAAPDEETARRSLTHFVRELLDDGTVVGADFALDEVAPEVAG